MLPQFPRALLLQLAITRSISITLVLSKVFERLVAVRLTNFMERKGALTSSQLHKFQLVPLEVRWPPMGLLTYCCSVGFVNTVDRLFLGLCLCGMASVNLSLIVWDRLTSRVGLIFLLSLLLIFLSLRYLLFYRLNSWGCGPRIDRLLAFSSNIVLEEM